MIKWGMVGNSHDASPVVPMTTNCYGLVPKIFP